MVIHKRVFKLFQLTITLSVTALFSCLIGAANARAESFDFLIESQDKRLVGFVDRESISRSGNTVTVWLLWVNVTPVELPDGSSLSYALRQNLYDCEAKTTTQLFVALYLMDGKPASTGPAPNIMAEPWIPASIGSTTGPILCDPNSEITSTFSLNEAISFARGTP